MSDFWGDLDAPYRLFSQYCDSADWHELVLAVAGAVTEGVPRLDRPISLLDIGCGTGHTTQTLCEHIFVSTNRFPVLEVVEPSPMAQDRLKGNLLHHTHSGPLQRTHVSIEAIPPDSQFDAVVLIHSSYYIADLPGKLRTLTTNHLSNHAVVCALVLPEHSPFFLGQSPLPNCADATDRALQSAGFKTNVFRLRSRFRVPTPPFADSQWDLIKRFMAPSITTREEFQRRLTAYLKKTNTLDFGDNLIVGTRSSG